MLAVCAALTAVGCGGDVPQEAVDPYADAFREGAVGDGEPVSVPTIDLSGVLLGVQEREALSTMVAVAEEQGVGVEDGEDGGRTPVRTRVPRVPRLGATAVAGGGSERPVVEGTMAVPVVTATPVVEVEVAYVVQSCVDDFRELIARDRGLVGRWFELDFRKVGALLQEREGEFDVEYVEALNRGFEASRPDCVEEGWSPMFSYTAECSGHTLDQWDVTSGGFYGTYQATNTSGRDRQGNFEWYSTKQEGPSVLIHFSKLPLLEVGGCWTGHMTSGTWAWQTTDGSESGTERPTNEVCNGALMRIAERLYGVGWDDGEWFVQTRNYLGGYRASCPRHNLEAVADPPEGCPVQERAGEFEGGVVVHWHPDLRYPEETVCWVGTDVGGGRLSWEGFSESGDRAEIHVPGA